VAELHHRQIRCVHFQQRKIGTRIGTHDRRHEFATVVHPDDDFSGVLDDMVVRQNVAVSRDDEARPERTALTERRAATASVGALRTATFRTEEAAEELVHVRIAAAITAAIRLLRGADIHHRGRVLFYQTGEIRQFAGIRNCAAREAPDQRACPE
jgi:hypothetical protein